MRTPSRNGLKGQQALSPGHRPGYKDMGKLALKGHKLYLLPSAFALSGRPIQCNTLTQGNALGLELAGLSGRLQQNSRNFSKVYFPLCKILLLFGKAPNQRSTKSRRDRPQITRISQNSKFINSKFKMRLRRGDFNNELKRISQRDLGYFDSSLFTFHFAEGDCHRLHRL